MKETIIALSAKTYARKQSTIFIIFSSIIVTIELT